MPYVVTKRMRIALHQEGEVCAVCGAAFDPSREVGLRLRRDLDWSGTMTPEGLIAADDWPPVCLPCIAQRAHWLLEILQGRTADRRRAGLKAVE